MPKIVGCTKVGLMDMLWCEECELEQGSMSCIDKRRKLGNGYIED